jgi:hypothetical protein
MKLAIRVNAPLLLGLVAPCAEAAAMQAVPPAPIVMQADRILDGGARCSATPGS